MYNLKYILIELSYFFLIKGITISPIVKYLRIKKKQNEEPTELAKLSYRAAENIMVAFEIINGVSGQNTLRQK